MSKEQIIDEVYLNYSKNHFKIWEPGMDYESKESFIRKCKTDSKFSEKCGLKIVERELSFEERLNIAIKMRYDSFDLDIAMGNSEDALSDYGIPTKLITLMYNNEKIEIYE